MSKENPRKQKQFMLDYVEKCQKLCEFYFCITHITLNCTYSQAREYTTVCTSYTYIRLTWDYNIQVYRTVPSESERTKGLLIKSFLGKSLNFFMTKCHLLLAKFTPMNNLFGIRLALKSHAFFLLAGKPKSKCLEWTLHTVESACSLPAKANKSNLSICRLTTLLANKRLL